MASVREDYPGYQPLKSAIHSKDVDFTKAIDLSSLDGRTILITGGASGLGAAAAKLWAAHGAHIMIGDINEKLGLEMVAEMRKATNNQNHQFFTCDVTQWQSQVSFFRNAARASPHGGIDVVVANAGIGDALEGRRFEEPPDYTTMDSPPDPHITRTIDINLTGVYYTSHLALSYLPRNPGSQACRVGQQSSTRDRQLILVSSIAGICPIPGMASYCSAKHGVVGLFRTLRFTAPIKHGIRVNMINPYFVKTPILGLGGELILAGGTPALIEDVVDILTRFVTDQGIIGRGCIIGTEATQEQANVLKLPHQGPVWDAYADDFQQTDVFIRRIIAVTNLQEHIRGWVGVFKDVFVTFASPIFGKFFG